MLSSAVELVAAEQRSRREMNVRMVGFREFVNYLIRV